jgi:glutathione synthase/RimK-type ligase-like ATP-grasp enzyme
MTKKGRRVGFVTCAQAPELTSDDMLIAKELIGRGADVVPVVWNSGMPESRACESLILRSTWDYHHHLQSFLAWVQELETEGVRLWNSPKTVRWNCDKNYLKTFEKFNLPIIDTIFPARDMRLSQLMEDMAWEKAVVKPAVAASAFNTRIVALEEADLHQDTFQRLFEHSDVLVQRYEQSIAEKGEISFLFFMNEFSHAVLKRPAPGEFRVQERLGGIISPYSPSNTLIDSAARYLNAVEEDILYARVDGIDVDGEFRLMELELIEPDLFCRFSDKAASSCAAAIWQLLTR